MSFEETLDQCFSKLIHEIIIHKCHHVYYSFSSLTLRTAMNSTHIWPVVLHLFCKTKADSHLKILNIMYIYTSLHLCNCSSTPGFLSFSHYYLILLQVFQFSWFNFQTTSRARLWIYRHIWKLIAKNGVIHSRARNPTTAKQKLSRFCWIKL